LSASVGPAKVVVKTAFAVVKSAISTMTKSAKAVSVLP
jgi:hypothetical protein